MLGRFPVVLAALTLVGAHAPSGFAQALSEVEGARLICSTGPDAGLARAERLRGAAEITAARVLPNPSLVVEHERALRGPTDEQTVVGISMPLGINGRRALLRDAAGARRDQAILEADTTLFEGALSFREAYARALVERERVEVLTHQQATLDALTTVIAGLTNGGETADYDLLRQRIYAQLHQQALRSAQARADASLVLLEAWLGAKVTLPSTDLFGLAGGPGLHVGPTGGSGLQHPRVRSLEAEAQASALEARAAARRWVPDLEVFAGYRSTNATRDTTHGVALSLRVPLTFFDHGQGESAQAHAAQQRAHAGAERLRRLNRARLSSLEARLGALTASVLQGEPVLADAATLVDKARQLYAAGEATITELLEAFRAAEDARLGLIDLAEELAQVRLDRMRALGTQLDAALDEACQSARGRAQ